MSLKAYRRKRHFPKTPEPEGGASPGRGDQYLIQKHAASHLHYDFRLELGGVLKSWAVPKGPSLDPAVKSLAVHVEDHPLEYGSFEGIIPEGEYGGGTVMLWDRGRWEPEGSAREAYRRGKLVFRLGGERLKGRWALIRMGGKAGADGKNWLLKKLDDDEARGGDDHGVLTRFTRSVATGRTMNQIAANAPAEASRRRKPRPSPARGARGAKRASASSKSDRRTASAGRARAIEAASLEGAVPARMPAAIRPQLPLLVDAVPQGEGWLHELKLDGYRMIGFVRDGKATLRTRRGNDWTDRFSRIARALEELDMGDAIFDGEIVALGADGSADFQALQNLMRGGDEGRIMYFVFDLLYQQGYDLRQAALVDRKQLLSQVIANHSGPRIIRYSDHISGQGVDVFASACGHGLEGIVSKRGGSHYAGVRGPDWVKVKCHKRQEFVIGGWTEPSGARAALGALLLGYYNASGELVYCGKVGTGFTEQSLRDLREALEPLEQDGAPFAGRLGISSRGVHWVEPKLMAEVAFGAWTAAGMLRHAVFQGMREDKNSGEIMREIPVHTRQGEAERGGEAVLHGAAGARRGGRARKPVGEESAVDQVASVHLTHPDRVLFPDAEITKRELAEYYAAVAPAILPHVVKRPLSVVRCPGGAGKACFFQRHLGDTMPDAVRGIAVQEKSGPATYIAIDDLSGLLGLVQMGVLEIHPWGSRGDRLDRPDRLIFDIDPADDLAWPDVVAAARQVGQRLEELGLTSFVRTTGGKGLHVVAPIERRSSWDELKTLSREFADALVRAEPRRYIATASKAKRAGKIFVDYLRNEQGATAVAAYSTRARSGAPVAAPLSWEELPAVRNPAQLTLRTVPRRLHGQRADPWEGFFDVRQALTRTMEARIRRW